jgi:hypothetical protein
MTESIGLAIPVSMRTYTREKYGSPRNPRWPAGFAEALHSHRRSTAHRPAPYSAASPPSVRKVALIFSIYLRPSRTGLIVLAILTNLRALLSLMVVHECALSLP